MRTDWRKPGVGGLARDCRAWGGVSQTRAPYGGLQHSALQMWGGAGGAEVAGRGEGGPQRPWAWEARVRSKVCSNLSAPGPSPGGVTAVGAGTHTRTRVHESTHTYKARAQTGHTTHT